MCDWVVLERAARREAELAGKIFATEDLVVGQPVAWAEHRGHRTDGFSEVHRVAEARPDPIWAGETYCGEKIPPAVCRVDLAVWPKQSLHECKWCVMGYRQSVRGAA